MKYVCFEGDDPAFEFETDYPIPTEGMLVLSDDPKNEVKYLITGREFRISEKGNCLSAIWLTVKKATSHSWEGAL